MNLQGRRTIFLEVSVLLLICLISNCGDHTPPVDLAKNFFLNQFVKIDGKGLFHLDFEKTNGLSSKVNSVDVYTMSYKATIVIDKKCVYRITKVPYTNAITQMELSANPPLARLVDPNELYATNYILPGSRMICEGQVVFQRTERGWEPKEITWPVVGRWVGYGALR